MLDYLPSILDNDNQSSSNDLNAYSAIFGAQSPTYDLGIGSDTKTETTITPASTQSPQNPASAPAGDVALGYAEKVPGAVNLGSKIVSALSESTSPTVSVDGGMTAPTVAAPELAAGEAAGTTGDSVAGIAGAAAADTGAGAAAADTGAGVVAGAAAAGEAAADTGAGAAVAGATAAGEVAADTGAAAAGAAGGSSVADTVVTVVGTIASIIASLF